MRGTIILVFFATLSLMNSDLDSFSTKKKACSDYNGQGRDQQAYSKDFCRTTEVDKYKCCFLKYKIDKVTYYNCIPLEMAEFSNIDGTISKKEASLKESLKNNNVKIKSLECDSSSYLYSSLLLLLVFLF